VRGAAEYSEAPPERAYPLDAFLFRDKIGYCQQFSGAMALMLRMGGIPARVAAGFSPGSLDKERGEYVVRDLDAHSWVEAYFPRIGWVAFDPTPADSPARSQATSDSLANASGGDASDTGGAGDRGSDPLAAGAASDDGGGVSRWLPVIAFVLGLGGLLATVALVRRRRAAFAALGIPPELTELHRALTRTGRAPEPGTTLAQLERRLGGTPEASAYVRTLRLGRYGGAPSRPTPAQRRELRRALGDGLGWAGRLRAWRALPPRPRELAGRLRLRPYTG
jgi:hypothetical protein